MDVTSVVYETNVGDCAITNLRRITEVVKFACGDLPKPVRLNAAVNRKLSQSREFENLFLPAVQAFFWDGFIPTKSSST